MRGGLLLALTALWGSAILSAQTFRPTDLVEPRFGSAGGNVFPGACVPFGLVRLGPDVAGRQPTSGYRPDRPVIGFSHTHTSGTGGAPRYGNLRVTPQAGPPAPTNLASVARSGETALPGYYATVLARYSGDVRAELTATAKVGVHRYTFWDWSGADSVTANLFLDVAAVLKRGKQDDARCTAAEVAFTEAGYLTGNAAFAGGWGGESPYRLYFFAGVDREPAERGVWRDGTLTAGERGANWQPADTAFGAYLSFRLPQRAAVELRVGVSTESTEDARRRWAEQAGRSFRSLRVAADTVWNERLGRVRVEGGLPEERRLFYSALRNTFLLPTETSRPGEFWDHYCLWDVFRTVMPLHTLLAPDHQRAVVRNLLRIYREEGWLPDAWLAGDYGQMQGGTSADVVLADAILKDLGGFDDSLAYAAVVRNATETSDDPGRYGRYPAGAAPTGRMSRRLEYAYNDDRIAALAGARGDTALANELRTRARAIFDDFYPRAKLFWPRRADGLWDGPVHRTHQRADHWNDPNFYESSPAVYGLYAPHAPDELIARHGGPAAFVDYLDDFFASGLFSLENEPAFHIPYLYVYAGRPDKTARRVRRLLDEAYRLHPRGLPGQDDSGATSSWYVWGALGLFPVAGQPHYLLAAPFFDRVVLALENDRAFVIEAHRTHPEAIVPVRYVLNGKLFTDFKLPHAAVVAGGKLEVWLE